MNIKAVEREKHSAWMLFFLGKLSARTEEYYEYYETDTMLAVYHSNYIYWFKATWLCYLEQIKFVHKTLHNRENGIII